MRTRIVRAMLAYLYALNELSASQLDAAALYRQARIHEDSGTREGLTEAARLYQEASKVGSREAMVALASLLAQGRGIPLNRKRASELLEEALARHYTPARLPLAILLMDSQDFHVQQRSVDLMAADASAGNQLAQFFLGVHLLDKSKPGHNLFAAERWMCLAARGAETALAARALAACRKIPEARNAYASAQARSFRNRSNEDRPDLTWAVATMAVLLAIGIAYGEGPGDKPTTFETDGSSKIGSCQVQSALSRDPLHSFVTCMSF